MQKSLNGTQNITELKHQENSMIKSKPDNALKHKRNHTNEKKNAE